MMKKDYFNNKTLLITGGTGSFGNAFLSKMYGGKYKEIRILSRDEKKQDDMRKTFSNKKVKFFLGDVRDKNSLNDAFLGVDFVFHAAALKQVPSCEFYPIEAVKTNILGTENVLDVSIKQKVKKVVCLSTDKAVYPINAMGVSKAMMEKVILAKSRNSVNTKICITRYGNVMASRGSVIPLFIDQVNLNKPITITDPEMTRFMMTLDDAIDLVIYAFLKGKSGEIYIQKSPGTTVLTLAKSVLDIMGKKRHQIKVIGTRHGEKKHEVLLNKEERAMSKDLGKYYCISPDLRDLNYDNYFENGINTPSNLHEYTSENTHRLDLKQTISLLHKLKNVSF